MGRLELSEGLSLVVLVPRGPPGALGTLERALDAPTFLGLLRRAARTPLQATALALPRLRLNLALDVVAMVHDMGKATDTLPTRDITAWAGWAWHAVTSCAGGDVQWHHSLQDVTGPSPVPMRVPFPRGPNIPRVPQYPCVPGVPHAPRVSILPLLSLVSPISPISPVSPVSLHVPQYPPLPPCP